MSKKLTLEEWIYRVNNIHEYKYDYSKVVYVNNSTKVCIICPIHGYFEINARKHLYGYGCPKCFSKINSKLEEKIKKILIGNNVIFDTQKTFDWLKHKKKLRLDFYLPEYNIAIECHGIQHFKEIEHFGGEEEFRKVRERDEIKKKLCEERNIIVIYYNYNDTYNILEKIKEYANY